MSKINLLSLQGEELSEKEQSLIMGGANGVTCHSVNCSASNSNVMANNLLANLRGQNPPPVNRPSGPSGPNLPG